MRNFNEMGLPAPLMQCLNQHNFTTPTPIQDQTIPLALEGKDVLGSAQTGTGKTLAFTIPVVAKLLNDTKSAALILTPTRELAQQVAASVNQLVGRNPQLQTALLIGGEPYPKQLSQLKRGPRIIVGTPGRVIDHMGRGTLRANNITTLVLDETDRMLDMGFGIQLDEIVNQIPKERQTLMFSATLLPRIEKVAAKYLINPERVFMTQEIQPIQKIQQETINVKEADKFDNLISQLNQREGSIIVFVKTKMNAEKLTSNLLRENHDVSTIHGDLRQKKRDQVMRDFRKGLFRIMVATDVAARGLDVPEIRHVINYNLPQCPEDYVHRIGRTARNGAEGAALNLVSPSENKLWMAIERFLDPTQKQTDSFGGRPFSKPRSSSSFGNRGFSGNRSSERPFSRDRDRDRGQSQSGGFGQSSRPARSRDGDSFQDRGSSFGGQRFNPRAQEGQSFNKPREFSSRDGNRVDQDRPRSSGRPGGEERSFNAERFNKSSHDRPFNRERNFTSDRPRAPREGNSWDKPAFSRGQGQSQEGRSFAGGAFKPRDSFSSRPQREGQFQQPANNGAFFRDFDDKPSQRPKKPGFGRPAQDNGNFRKPAFAKKRPQ